MKMLLFWHSFLCIYFIKIVSITYGVIIVLPSVSVQAQLISESVQDVLQSIQKVVTTLQDFVGDDKGCRFLCNGGELPEPNPYHRPSSNGCGAFGIQLDSEISIKSVTACCDEHDICYDTCMKKKDECDTAFKHCLKSVCKKGKKVLTDQLYEACKSTADIMYTGTMALGCKPYKDAQRKACFCRRQKTDL